METINIEKELLKLKDERFQKFQEKLCPGVNNIIGIKIPILRAYAKEINGNVDISTIGTKYYEEIILKGMLIGLEKKLDFEQIENYVKLIDNWAVCDVFCAGLKQVKKHKEEMWQYIEKYLNSKKEYEVRFAVVIMLDFYIEEKYIEIVLERLRKIKHEGYYAKMAVAWAYSICFIKFYEKTKEEFKNINKKTLDKFIYNKSLQKAIESYRLNNKQKEELRKMKIK